MRAIHTSMIVLLVGCSSGTASGPEDDADANVHEDTGHDASPADDADEAEAEVVADADRSEADVDPGPREGPISFVVETAELLSSRMCDLDADGVEDNAIADLGAVEGELFRQAANVFVQEALGVAAGVRYTIHFPWVGDLWSLTEPDLCLFPVAGMDTDFPPDGSDDFDGDELFEAWPMTLDECGEPLFASSEMSLDGGTLAGSMEAIPIWFMQSYFEVTNVVGEGIVTPRAEGIEFSFCGVAAVDELGALAIVAPTGDLTLLELFLAGGAALGMPSAPGLDPDLDLDGDGLERFELDGQGRITSCVDGDLSPIAGRDCWQDERIADGFSLTFRVDGASAVLGGFHTELERTVSASCPEPPAETFWDGC